VALPATALTSVSAVLDELDLVDDGGVVLARVERYIKAASRAVEMWTGRRFDRGAVVETLPGYGTFRLRLRRTPILEVDSVSIEGVVVPESSYIIDNGEDGTGGALVRLDGPWPWSARVDGKLASAPLPGSEKPNIIVSYTGGWVTPAQATDALPRTLPDDIEDAVIQMVSSRWRGRGRDGRMVSEAFTDSTYTWGGAPVPPGVAAVISYYSRMALG
jgi:hypothetical protein